MRKRIKHLRDDDAPKVWEDRPISRQRWQRHRDYLMRCAGSGRRPTEWWVYDRKMQEPEFGDQAKILREMGELSEAELREAIANWRRIYDDAVEHEEFAKAHGWKSQKREEYWLWHEIPDDVIERFDRAAARRANIKAV